MLHDFLNRGWACFPYDPQIAEWVAAARPVAERIAHDPDIRARWLRCGGTWFAGVNVFPNTVSGSVPDQGVPELAGDVIRFIQGELGVDRFDWDPAQISICYPGYPQPWDGESDAAFRFRRDRDAAHVDGLRRIDPGRRRSPSETHAFILGLPLNPAPEGAAPLVIYEGSHQIMRAAFRARLESIASEAWTEEDVTDAYTQARREAFDTCRRLTITAQPGEAYLVHRLALHGVAPWTAAEGAATHRAIAYFRPDPQSADSPEWWLETP